MGVPVQDWIRSIAFELARLAVLLCLAALASAVIGVLVTDTSFLEFFRDLHLDRDGRPMAAAFFHSLRKSLPILVASFVFLALGSILCTAVYQTCWSGGFKVLVMAVSAMPSFLIPFLPSLLWSRTEFLGLSSGALWVPAICLAIGDSNLATVSAHLRENLRTQRALPHLQIIESLGQPVWRYIWPRTALTLMTSVSGRLPHMIGGLVALELVYNIRGLGIQARDAVGNMPADLHWFFWICGFCVIMRVLFRWLEALFRLIWDGSRQQTLESVDDETADPAPPEFSISDIQHVNLVEVAIPLQEPVDEFAPPPGRLEPLKNIRRNLRFYIAFARKNLFTAIIAAVMVLAFVLLLAAIWAYGDVPAVRRGADSGDSRGLGTDSSGEDLISSARKGMQQLVVPTAVAMLLGICALPCALAALFRWIQPGRMRRGLRILDSLFVFIAEFLESLPKLLILLAAYSVVSSGVERFRLVGVEFEVNLMVLRLFAIIGLLHAPQVYRAARDELLELNSPIYLESSLLIGVRVRQLVWNTILRNRCLHVVCVESATIAAGVLHYDAVLGYVGLGQRGVIFTWGSSLGSGARYFMGNIGLEWFNPWVLGFPLLVVWLGIVACWTVAESIKTLSGGYVYRLR